MADTWVTAVGFVQFDPRDRDANGKQITELVIKTPGGGDHGGKQIRVTVWPEHLLDEKVEKGDFIAVDGKFTTSSYQDANGVARTGLQISASTLVVLKPVPRKEREVVRASESNPKDGDPKVPF